MARQHDLRDCPTVYECRDRLPGLSSWMTEEVMKQLPIWQGRRFEPGQVYFDLDNPERSAFAATGDEGLPTDHTYVCRGEATERAWAQLITWNQPVDQDQGQQINTVRRDLGVGIEHSAAGEARPRPRP